MHRLLHHWVTEQAERHPDAIAAVMNGESLTYGQLDLYSNQLGRALKEAGCEKGDRVGILLPKAPFTIVSIIAALKADCIFVPIDVAGPTERVGRIIHSCEPRVLLAGEASSDLLRELIQIGSVVKGTGIGWMGRIDLSTTDRKRTHENADDGGEDFKPRFSASDLAAFSGRALPNETKSSEPTHILFTSGSTGTPKGVVITHDNVLAFLQWAVKYFGLNNCDRCSGHPPLHFDLSTFDIFGTFAAGAELHLVSPEINLLPNKLSEFIRASAITQWFSVPSILNYMAKFDVVRIDDFPKLKRLLWCGEVLPTPALTYWMSRLPHVKFTNLYGPTEATIASSYYTVPCCPVDEKAQIPIGTACDGEELLVLNEKMERTRPGEVGDLYIRGAGLSPGYWRDAEKTQAVFVRNPESTDPNDRIYKTGDLAKAGEDGLVYFLGRADSQIKCRGYRIELGEIETAVNALDCMKECAVVAIETEGFEGNVICCAFTPSTGVDVRPPDLRKRLTKVLPNYMLPARWLCFDALPKNANGKTDRRKLKELFREKETSGVEGRLEPKG